ncbi:hypothetical protein J2D73_04300 [Acetobacter sacchari]|uniref:Uncharacterized protein n=1 Tax=Acetobacter sacchari TaxID=2661687 RepID=A0ABS3LT06_9PROT|nr:hypothetical protein [Acetobacter sacchari]MBO1359021.1 hypothetical protein [Acetobacter sacchari]
MGGYRPIVHRRNLIVLQLGDERGYRQAPATEILIFSSLPHRAAAEVGDTHLVAAAEEDDHSRKVAALRQAVAAYRDHRAEVRAFHLAAVAGVCSALPRA